MSVRSIAIGLTLGLLISAGTYYNDFVIQQTSLINHLLPISVLGFALLLMLGINPLLRAMRAHWVLRPAEIGIITLIGLAACTWPGAGFFRTATTNLVMPGNQYPRETSWQGKEVMSYVPGGSVRLGHGHVSDWPAVIAYVNAGAADHGPAAARTLWSAMTEADRRVFADAQDADEIDETRLLDALNEAISGGVLADTPHGGDPSSSRAAQTRAALVQLLPEAILPPPAGSGVLFEGGQQNDATDAVVLGPASGQSVGLTQVPWRDWADPARLWGLTALLLGGAVVCLALIVHPQWSRNELLPYPIARFVSEMTRQRTGWALPAVATKPSFWIAASVVFGWHLTGVLSAWFPELPALPCQVNFWALGQLFPDAAQVKDIRAYLNPRFYPGIIALAFFLSRPVSFSIGITPLCYIILGTVMLKRGEVLQGEYLGVGAENMLRFGSWLAMAGVIAYTGRRYYTRLGAAALGFKRQEIAASGVWAVRCLVVLIALAVAALTTGGLSWVFALMIVLLILLMFLVLARITAETGLFFIQPYWMPVAVLTGLFGVEVIGPTTYVVGALASTMLVGDVRTALLGNLVNGLKIAESTGTKQPARMVPWLLVMIVAGFIVAAGVTLCIQYNYGLGGTDAFTKTILPAMPFDQLDKNITEAQMVGSLANATIRDGQLNLGDAYLSPTLYGWMIAGALLLLGFAVIRLRVSWWPLHPVIFLIWGTFPAVQFATSFLVGWAIKSCVTSVGGANACRKSLPIMIGLLVGDIAAALLGILVGAIYYLLTGQTPVAYRVF